MTINNDSSFMKGYIYPQPLMSKLTINANLSNSYKYIGMTYDLLQNHPELFKNTASNLLYIVNVNTNYRADVMYEMFKAMINTDSLLSRNDSLKILLPEVLVETNTILDTTIENSLNLNQKYSQTASILHLMVYYLKKYKVFNVYEPVFNNIIHAFESFKNNPQVFYNGERFDYKVLKPLCYTTYGVNYFEDLVYWAYFFTFFINGRPYRFFDEIGSDSLSSRLYASINDYFASYYKKLSKDLQIKNTDDWSVLYSTIIKEKQLLSFQNMLDKMLSVDNLIALRNNEMNKSNELLDECFRDQNVLSQQFIQEAFKRNMDKITELIIQHNPFNRFKFNMFSGKSIESITNYHSLMQLTQLCLTSTNYEKSGFEIDDKTFNFYPFQNFKVFETLGKPIIESNINELIISKIKKPFTRADLFTQIAVSYIWTKLIERQSDGIFQTEGLGTESIEISNLTVAQNGLTTKLLNIFINGLYQKDYSNMNLLFNKFNLINELVDLNIAMRYIYPTDYYKNDLLPILMLSYFKDGIMQMILSNSSMTGDLISTKEISNGLRNNALIDNLQDFNLHRYFFNVDIKHEKHLLLTSKLENLFDALLFVEHSGYARFVNACTQDLSKYLNESSIEMPLVIGNDDDCLRYAVGGIQLYDKMIDVNPFNRGCYYIKDLLGNTEKLHYFFSVVKYFDDVSKIGLIKNNTSMNTIKDILYSIGQDHVKKLMEHKTHRELVEYEIKVDGSRIYAEVISFDNFVAKNGSFIEDILTNVYHNIVGSFIENKVICASISPITGCLMKLSENKFGNGGFCTIEESNADVYELPVFKFRGSFESFNFKFTKPSGTKLLCNGLSILDNEGAKSLKIFIFTGAPLNTGFNMYKIEDI